MTEPTVPHEIIVGVDTHKDVHVAVAIDHGGRTLGTKEVCTTQRGSTALHEWATAFAPTVRYAIEGTGSYGAGLARYLAKLGCEVTEVRGPNRKLRHDRGKSDPIDAEAAARAVLAGTATGIPKDGDVRRQDW